jgi:hypothetical protein
MVWKPDISLQNGFTDLSELGSTFIQVKISYNGTVTWRPFQIFESKCVLDSTYFPFDTQECDLEFVAWSLSRKDVYLAQDSIMFMITNKGFRSITIVNLTFVSCVSNSSVALEDTISHSP